MQGWRLGLQLGLAAFLAFLVGQLLPGFLFLFMLLALGMAAVLSGDARRAGTQQGRVSMVGLVVLAVGFVAVFLADALARRATGDAAPPDAVAVGFAADVAVAAGFYLLPQHLAADRSRLFLGLAFGASIAIAAAVAWTATRGDLAALQAAVLARGLPYILFAWAYAMMLGRLQRTGGPPAPPSGPVV